jgi:hypothetical protein
VECSSLLWQKRVSTLSPFRSQVGLTMKGLHTTLIDEN